MRLVIFTCLLLASVAVAERNRRPINISNLKNLLTSAIYGRNQINIQPQPIIQEETGYKLFRLPGYEDIMIRVAPKKPVVEEELVYPPAVEQVNLNGFETVVGTRPEDTIVTVKEVEDLGSPGFYYEGHNNVMKETIVPRYPFLDTPLYVEERIKTAPVIEARPVLTEVISPLEEKVEIKLPFAPKYTYRQIQRTEPVITYDNQAVEVLENIKMKTELPLCIKKRVDEAIVLGADPNRFASVQEVYQYQSPTVVDFPYPRVDANQYAKNSFHEKVFTEEFKTGGSPQRLISSKDSAVRYNLRPTKTQAINPHPIPLLHSQKSLQLGGDISATKDKVISQIKKVPSFSNLAEYITNLSNRRGAAVVSNENNMKQMKAVPFVGSKDNVSNANIPINVYKVQPNPNTGKVASVNNVLKTNVNGNTHYISAPSTNREAPKKDGTKIINVVYTNKVTEKPKIVTSPVAAASINVPKVNVLRENIQTAILNKPIAVTDVKNDSFQQTKAEDSNEKVTGKPLSVTSPIVVPNTNAPKLNALRENIQTSIISKPIAVKDAKNYSYQQKKADGSSVNVNGGKNGVSVSVLENNNRGRGDIPDQ